MKIEKEWKEYIIRWRTDYCSGHPMPSNFRMKCSEIFEKICKSEDYISAKVFDNSVIYRAINVSNIIYLNRKFTTDDNLYYSFSRDMEGIKEFCLFDKYLKTGKFILLECFSLDALDYEQLLSCIYENYDATTDRYAKEHEVVSRITESNIKNIYYVKEISELENLDSCAKLTVKDLTKSRLKRLMR